MFHEHDNEDDFTPKRDRRGRFLKGRSGNWSGRPRKAPPEDWTLQRAFASALTQRVPVNGPDGPHEMELRDLLVHTCVRTAVKGKLSDILRVLETARQHNAFEHLNDAPEEGCFTEEHYRLLEIVEREFPQLSGFGEPQPKPRGDMVGREGGLD